MKIKGKIQLIMHPAIPLQLTSTHLSTVLLLFLYPDGIGCRVSPAKHCSSSVWKKSGSCCDSHSCCCLLLFSGSCENWQGAGTQPRWVQGQTQPARAPRTKQTQHWQLDILFWAGGIWARTSNLACEMLWRSAEWDAWCRRALWVHLAPSKLVVAKRSFWSHRSGWVLPVHQGNTPA